MEPLSEQRIAMGYVPLAMAVRAANDALVASTGNGFRVAQCLRSYAESDADYAKGRTAPGPIVTNAPGGHSWHNFGMAVDCYPFMAGQSGPLVWSAGHPLFQAMVAALKAQGLAWGGDWVSLKDYPHFQPSNIPVSPTDADRAAFASGGLTAVWAQVRILIS